MSPITVEEAEAMLRARDLIAVGARGDEERRRRHGARTTFVRVLEVHVDAVPETLPASTAAGEVRVVGRPQSTESAVAAVRRARTLAAGTPLTAFSLADLVSVAGGQLSRMLSALHEAGLEAIAEAPIDLLPNAAAAIRAAREAGVTVRRITVASASSDSDVAVPPYLMKRVTDLQRVIGGIRAFAPLPRTSSVTQPSTGYDDVKTIATARLLVDNVESIQVDWALYGPKLAQVALTMGADDVDSVSPLQGDLGRRRSPIEEIRGNIHAAGLDPVERDGFFETVRAPASDTSGQGSRGAITQS